MALPKIWKPWSNLETTARAPFTWRSISNKWMERDRSAAFRPLHYPLSETTRNFSGGDSGNWITAVTTEWDFDIPRQTESLLFRAWWWWAVVGVTSAKIRWEVGVGSGNYTTESILSTVKDVPRWSDCIRDISGDGIGGTRVKMRLEQNVVFTSGGNNLHHFQVQCIPYQSSDELN